MVRKQVFPEESLQNCVKNLREINRNIFKLFGSKGSDISVHKQKDVTPQ